MSILLTAVICSLAVHTFGAKLSSNVKQCQFKDPNFEECLRLAVQDTINQQLTKPNKELGLPSLEPLVIPSLSVGAGTGAVGLVQNYKDFKIHGYSNVSLDKIDWNFEKNYITAQGHFNDKVIFEAEYNITGKILLLPVYGSGPCRIQLDNVKGEIDFQLEVYEKNGQKYYKAVSHRIKIQPSQVHFHFENLFNGDRGLGDNINLVINDNWKEIFDDIYDGYEKAISEVNLAMFNSVFSKFSIEEVFGKQ